MRVPFSVWVTATRRTWVRACRVRAMVVTAEICWVMAVMGSPVATVATRVASVMVVMVATVWLVPRARAV